MPSQLEEYALRILRTMVEEGGALRGKISNPQGAMWLHQGGRHEQPVQTTAAQQLLQADLIEFEKDLTAALYEGDKLYRPSNKGRDFIASLQTRPPPRQQ